MPHSHRSDSASSHTRRKAPQFYDDKYTRPRSRHSHPRHSPHHQDHHDDDIDSGYGKTYTRDHSSHSNRPTSYHPQYHPDMYASNKVAYPELSQHPPQYRHSQYHNLPLARYDDAAYDSSDSDPRPLSRTSGRHATFPPSAYYASGSKQMQPYKQPYVHPAMPPQSPALGSMPPNSYRHQPKAQYSQPGYDAPRYTYQPPTAEPLPDYGDSRPRQLNRADTWSNDSPPRRRASAHIPSRKGSMSVPPHGSRGPASETGERPQDKKSARAKAKEIYKSSTANNYAELALVGVIALAKAL